MVSAVTSTAAPTNLSRLIRVKQQNPSALLAQLVSLAPGFPQRLHEHQPAVPPSFLFPLAMHVEVTDSRDGARASRRLVLSRLLDQLSQLAYRNPVLILIWILCPTRLAWPDSINQPQSLFLNLAIIPLGCRQNFWDVSVTCIFGSWSVSIYQQPICGLMTTSTYVLLSLHQCQYATSGVRQPRLFHTLKSMEEYQCVVIRWFGCMFTVYTVLSIYKPMSPCLAHVQSSFASL